MEHGEHCRLTDRLFESTYDELCRVARRSPLARTSFDLADGAALVHETYVRFRRGGCVAAGRDRRRFLTRTRLAMRTVARDRWRRRNARKRGGGQGTVLRPDTSQDHAGDSSTALREALDRLGAHNPGWLAVVLHCDLLGRTVRETAKLLDLSEVAVKSRRRRALIWLRRTLGSR